MHLNPTKCQHQSLFYGNIVIIHELEDKMCCISKLQIDRDSNRLIDEIQERMNLNRILSNPI